MTDLLLAAQGGGGWGFLITMIVVFAIMYLLMIRPQQKQQKKIKAFQNSLEEGAEVITNGGIYGKVKSVDYTTNKVSLEISKGVVISVDKNYVFATAKDMPAK
ncbi:MAG: preprotein translocase subunit YajC [Prevotella sp.]|nr:preprotein translocase subunit YajC [Prevotella sp.]